MRIILALFICFLGTSHVWAGEREELESLMQTLSALPGKERNTKGNHKKVSAILQKSCMKQVDERQAKGSLTSRGYMKLYSLCVCLSSSKALTGGFIDTVVNGGSIDDVMDYDLKKVKKACIEKVKKEH